MLLISRDQTAWKSIVSAVSRDIEAPINQGTKTPLNYKQSWDKTLGYLTANYTFNEDWSVYAQAAQGFLTPNLNQFYVPNPTANNTRPTQTMNYQFGTVYKTERFNAELRAAAPGTIWASALSF